MHPAYARLSVNICNIVDKISSIVDLLCFGMITFIF